MAGQRLGQWLLEAGGQFSNSIKVQEEGCHGRAIFAVSDIGVGELVIRVPGASLVTPQMGRSEWRRAGLSMLDDIEDDETWLAIYIALEYSNVNSYHRDYMRTLPTPEQCRRQLPLMWDLQDSETLRYAATVLQSRGHGSAAEMSALMEEVSSLQDAASAEYRMLRGGSIPITLPFSLELFKYSYAIVNSRNFFVSNPVWVNGGRACMVPFADMLNHAGAFTRGGKESLQWKYNAKFQALDFLATRAIPCGEELCINYSSHYSGQDAFQHQQPPFHFLVFYGFLEELSTLSKL